jgi:hypothetical protein
VKLDDITLIVVKVKQVERCEPFSRHFEDIKGPWGSENNKPKNIRTKFRKKDRAFPHIIRSK